MFKLAAVMALVAGPAFATGLEIDVGGEANGTIKIDLFEDTAPLHVAQIVMQAIRSRNSPSLPHEVMS